ncbi:MAG TPA: TonB-dependent receptor [Bacteroidota bacterium]|nr:TonB-dependent receptor [Bacteroidota bacterium]
MRPAGMLIAGLLACALPGALRAQDAAPPRDTVYQMSPVVVTATQATERKTPVSFSNLTPRDIRERYSLQDVPALLAELPSVTTYSENGNGIGYNYINIRGFDQRRISVMINGVPQNDPEDHNVYWIDFPDLLSSTDNVQVQRGAGNAFYGPAAIGGSVNIVTNPFSGEPGLTFEAVTGFQQFGDSTKPFPLTMKKYSASFTSGLVGGRYMFYAHLGKITSDGYRTNSWVDQDSYFFGAIRFDGDMSTRVHFFGGPIQDGLAYDGLGKFANGNLVLRRQNVVAGWTANAANDGYDFVQYRRPQEVESFSQPHAEVINDWHLSHSLTLHNTFFYYTGDGYFDYDASWADTTMLRLGSQYGIPTANNPGNTLVRAFVGSTQWGWLPRLDIDHGRGELTVGGEMRFHRSTHWGKIEYAEGLPAGLDPDYHFYEFNGGKDMLSAYVHELFRLDDLTNLMGDLQLVSDRYTFSHEKFLGNTFAVPYLFLNPRAGINVNLTEAWSTYVSAAYTSREPQLTNLYDAESSTLYDATPQFRADTVGGAVVYDFSKPLIVPEKLLDLEWGLRATEPGAEGSVTVYLMDFHDELVETGQVNVFGEPITGNASHTRHEGIELEGAVRLAGPFTLSGTLTASRNRIIHATGFPGGGTAEVLDGNPIGGFPDVLGNARLTYRTESVTASVLGRYIGAFHTDNYNDENNTTDAAVVFDGQVVVKLPPFAGTSLTLRGEIRNIFDTLYLAGGQGNTFFPAAERNVVFGLSLHL